jgi:hypothetical protein
MLLGDIPHNHAFRRSPSFSITMLFGDPLTHAFRRCYFSAMLTFGDPLMFGDVVQVALRLLASGANPTAPDTDGRVSLNPNIQIFKYSSIQTLKNV